MRTLHRRPLIALLMLMMLFLATTPIGASESGLSWQSLSVPGEFLVLDGIGPNTPVTIRAQYRFTNQESLDALDGLWLAGLSTQPNTPPTFLSVVWSEVTAGWFPTRGIQLQSDQALFASSASVRQGGGFLAGSEYLSLLMHQFEVGQALEVQLNYDPRSGAAALNILDLANNKSLYAAEYALKPYNGTLYPVLGLVTDKPGIQVEHFSAVPYNIPVGTQWSFLVKAAGQSQHEPLYITRVRDSSELALQLETAGASIGAFELSANQGESSETVLRVPATTAQTGKIVQPFQAKALPKGPIVLSLQYVDELGRKWLLGTHSLDIILGNVKAVFEPISIQAKALNGALKLASEDEVVEQVKLRVTAHIKEYGASSGTGLLVIDQQLARLTTSTLTIPYVIPLAEGWEFFELHFTVDFDAAVNTTVTGDRFHVLW